MPGPRRGVGFVCLLERRFEHGDQFAVHPARRIEDAAPAIGQGGAGEGMAVAPGLRQAGGVEERLPVGGVPAPPLGLPE